MDNIANNNLYEVTCEGEYYAYSNGVKAVKPYTITVKLDDVAKKIGFLSVIKNHILKEQRDAPSPMKKLYGDWRRYRTHVITEVRNVKTNAPVKELQLMNRAQVIAYINAKGYPIECDLYPSITDLRQALRDYNQSSDQFLKHQARRREVKGPSMDALASLKKLNPDLMGAAPTPTVDVNPVKIKTEEDVDFIAELDETKELAELVGGL